ncbi:mitochondrial inner-membrane-bound regulator-domain-containing protein [Tuber brumale]|nr:mitochondrial inner-membrane-bound regulator-domain-containing protein [Tuber brumale]
MPPASYSSNLATCLCRQFRRPSCNVRILQVYARRFNTSPRWCSEEKEKESNKIGLEPVLELLILQNPGPRKPRHEGLRFPRDPIEAKALDDTQDLLLRPEALESDKNIDIALTRPASVLVSKERYEQLAQGLCRAFLRPQLYEYYHYQDGEERALPRLLSSANKREIIDGILSAKWGVAVSRDIPERLDVLVNSEFSSTRRDIFFILGKDGRVIRQLSQEFQARVRVNVESGSIGVFASVENFERLREAVQGLLEKVTVEEFDMSWAQRLCQFNKQFITPIARITGTYIEKKDQKTLLISALDSSSLQDARRLLFLSFDLQLRSSYSLLYNAPEGLGGPKGALYPVHEKSALPWNFREVEWGRWRNVKTHIDHSNSHQGRSSAILKDTLRRRIGGVLQGADITTGLREILDHNDLQVSAQHQSELLPKYEAILGYLLHENSDPQPDQDLTVLEFIKSKDRLQVLLTDVPGLVHITQGLSPIGDTTSEGAPHSLRAQEPTGVQQTPYQTCIVKLLPSPWEFPEGFDRYPPLELKFSVDPELGRVGLPSLKAIHSSAVADIIFPSEECDVRFHHQKSIPLGVLGDPANPQSKYGVTQSELQRYMSESTLNPLTDDKLKASQFLSVTLPEWMISPPKRSESKDREEERNPPTKMLYISTGLEYRRELAFDWNGMKLYQTVIQGGITGGKRSELKLCWSNSEGVGSVAEAPRIAELEGDDKGIGKIAGGSGYKLAFEGAPEAVAETVVASDTDAADGIPSKPIADTGAEDLAELGDRTTKPTADQSLQYTPKDPSCSSSDPQSSFADFLTNTADLVNRLGKFLASREWRFTTQYMEHVEARGVTRSIEPATRSRRGVRSGGGDRGNGSSGYNCAAS